MKILLTESQFFKLLNEALSPEMTKKYTTIMRSEYIQDKLNEIFNNIKEQYPNYKENDKLVYDTHTIEKGDRIYINFGSDLKKRIENELKKFEYDLVDFTEGIVVNIKGGNSIINKQQIKLGKVLTKIKRQDLLDEYNYDKSRNSLKEYDYTIVFSKNAYDIAGMSTDRNWSSCMNVESGSNARYVTCDIKEGSIISYLTEKDDINIDNPEGRILIKPYINLENNKDIIYVPEGKTYGNVPSQFRDFIYDSFKKINKNLDGILFKINPNLYDDNEKLGYEVKSENIKSFKRFKQLIKKLKKTENREFHLDQILELLRSNEIVLDYVLTDKEVNTYLKHNAIMDSNYNDIKKYINVDYLIDNFNDQDLIDLYKKHPEIKKIIVDNPIPFLQKNIKVLLTLDKDYINYLKFKKQKFTGDEIYQVLSYQPDLFEYFFNNYKTEVIQERNRLTDFIFDNSQYFMKYYNYIKDYMIENYSYYWVMKKFSALVVKEPKYFVFIYNNDKKFLDTLFKDTYYCVTFLKNTIQNMNLFHLFYSYYTDIVKNILDTSVFFYIKEQPKLLLFLIKFDRDILISYEDNNHYYFLKDNPIFIPLYEKHLPEIFKRMDKVYIRYLQKTSQGSFLDKYL